MLRHDEGDQLSAFDYLGRLHLTMAMSVVTQYPVPDLVRKSHHIAISTSTFLCCVRHISAIRHSRYHGKQLCIVTLKDFAFVALPLHATDTKLGSAQSALVAHGLVEFNR